MPRPTLTLFRQLPSLTSPSRPFHPQNTATYAIGLSYASKNSPPFVDPASRPPKYGFGNPKAGGGKGKWVNDALGRRAGRGVLSGEVVGGWDEGLREETRRWGAGEDFFAVIEPRDVHTEEDPLPSSHQYTHLAISDGVGGWSDVVDPSFFSQALMYHYNNYVKQDMDFPPVKHMKRAYESLMKDGEVLAGGATACAVSLSPEGVLRGVNMGDSGCSVYRNGKQYFATPSLTHYFNCPKQLSKVPKQMQSGNVVHDTFDNPSSFDTFQIDLLPGDVIALYTDGLVDNAPAEHYPLLLSQLHDLLYANPDNAHLTPLDAQMELARLFADVLVAYGRTGMQKTGAEEGWKTPFQVEAAKEGLRFEGGKVDDITVVTAVVGERNPED